MISQPFTNGKQKIAEKIIRFPMILICFPLTCKIYNLWSVAFDGLATRGSGLPQPQPDNSKRRPIGQSVEQTTSLGGVFFARVWMRRAE